MSLHTEIYTDDTSFLRAISALEEEMGPKNLLKKHYDLDGEAASNRIYRWYDGGVFVGYAVASDFPNGLQDDNGDEYTGTKWWLRSFVIFKDFQGRHHGQTFLSAIRNDIRDNIYLETLVKSAGFYIKCGAWSLVYLVWIHEGKSPMVLAHRPIASQKDFDTLLEGTCFEGRSDGYDTTLHYFDSCDE